MNEEWGRRTRQEKEVGASSTVPCSCPWRPCRLVASWRLDSTVAIRSPIIGEQRPPFGERTPLFGKRMAPFGERKATFGERMALIFGHFARSFTMRGRNTANSLARGNHWRAESVSSRPFCQIFKDLQEWSEKKMIASEFRDARRQGRGILSFTGEMPLLPATYYLPPTTYHPARGTRCLSPACSAPSVYSLSAVPFGFRGPDFLPRVCRWRHHDPVAP